MRQVVIWVLSTALVILPGLVSAQAPAGTQTQPPAQHEPQPQAQPQPDSGMTCQGGVCQMNPEQMKQMQGKMGQGCMMQSGKECCPMHQQMQKQLDELRQRVEALEKQTKGKKK
jgi:hypothetical protein